MESKRGERGGVNTLKMPWERVKDYATESWVAQCPCVCPSATSALPTDDVVTAPEWSLEQGAQRTEGAGAHLHRGSVRETREGGMASHNCSSPVSQLGGVALYLHFRG